MWMDACIRFWARWYVAYALLCVCTSLHRTLDNQIILIRSSLSLCFRLLFVCLSFLSSLSRSPSRVHDHKVNSFSTEYEILTTVFSRTYSKACVAGEIAFPRTTFVFKVTSETNADTEWFSIILTDVYKLNVPFGFIGACICFCTILDCIMQSKKS